MENDLVEKIDKEGTQNWSELVAQPSEWIILILQRKVLMEAVVVVTSRYVQNIKLIDPTVSKYSLKYISKGY